MTTRMWQEIQDQSEVALRLAEVQLPALSGVTRLILSGTGASLGACRVADYAFRKYAGLLPHVLPAAELDSVQPAPGTLVILVSQSGESLETSEAIRTLKARAIPFWGVTNNRSSHLATAADQLLWMNAGEEVSSATKTYTATLLLLFALAGAPVAQVAADLRQTLSIAVDAWAAALERHDVFYLLGFGPLAATAQVGALLFKEKTYLHVEGMSLSEFRHGNIEVVKPGLPLILLALTPAATAEAVRHGEYFAMLGANVFLLTDSPVKTAPDVKVMQVQNSADDVVGQISAVVPLQLLAERIASRKGYAVDGFRYISKVVDKYQL